MGNGAWLAGDRLGGVTVDSSHRGHVRPHYLARSRKRGV
jgi:hypothetical protein